MDYSSLPNDPDHPVGSSPWQSSPQPSSGPSFGTPEPGDSPSSPLAQHSSTYTDRSQLQSEDGSEHDQIQTQSDILDGTTAASKASSLSEQTQRNHGQALKEDRSSGQQHLHQEPQQYSQLPQPTQPHQKSSVPNRYHTGARTGQRQNPPQYKLQARISSLERPGRKELILRFDVHVC